MLAVRLQRWVRVSRVQAAPASMAERRALGPGGDVTGKMGSDSDVGSELG